MMVAPVSVSFFFHSAKASLAPAGRNRGETRRCRSRCAGGFRLRPVKVQAKERMGPSSGGVARILEQPAERIEGELRCTATAPQFFLMGQDRATRDNLQGHQSAAGTRIEPPVSVPIAARADCSCTLAAAPLEEPPLVRRWKRRFWLHAIAVVRIFSRTT